MANTMKLRLESVARRQELGFQSLIAAGLSVRYILLISTIMETLYFSWTQYLQNLQQLWKYVHVIDNSSTV
jgi:hypothetical protein